MTKQQNTRQEAAQNEGATPALPEGIAPVWVNKAGEHFELDTNALTEAGLRYLIEYGLKQSLNDAVAGHKGDAAEAADLCHKRLTSIHRGTVGSGGGGGDPLAKTIRAVLAERVAGWKEYSAAAKRQTVAKIAAGEGNEAAQAIRAEAERRLEEQAKLSAEGLGLG